MSKSLYATLEINENASIDEIKKAYRKLARKYHPDINKEEGAEEKFKEITAAYEILSDPEKKAQYDQFGDGMFGGQNFSDFARGTGGGINLDDILSQIFGSGGGFSTRNTGGFGFSTHFGHKSKDPYEELSLHDTLIIPMSIAISGGKHRYSGNQGSFDIKIPAGVRNGETIRLKGKGKRHMEMRGDLFLKIKIESDQGYDLSGDDLKKKFEIPLKIALFGGSIEVETPHKNVTLKIPQGVKNGQKFRLKELGAINRKSGAKGDLYLEANIVIPLIDTLSPELKDLLQKEL